MDDGLVEMVVESVRVHMLSSRHVVILKETDRDRYLPIWIGPWEASAIAMKLQGLTPERPLTHDLFAATLEELGARVDRVVISDARRRDVPRPAPPRARRPDGRGRRAAVRRAGARGPGRRAGSSPREAVLEQAALGARRRRSARRTRAAGRSPLETTGEQIVDPRLDVFRDFVNSLDVDPGRRATAELTRGELGAPAASADDRRAAAERPGAGSTTSAAGATRSRARRGR